MSETDLKPCPFCGGKPSLTHRDVYVHDMLTGELIEHDETPLVYCRKCNDFAKFTIPVWNSRPAEDAVRARLGDAEERERVANDLFLSVVEYIPEYLRPYKIESVGSSDMHTIHAEYDESMDSYTCDEDTP